MVDAFLWYVIAQVVGIAAFPLLFRLLPMLRERGYSVSKPFGLLLIGYSSWILSQFHILPNTQLALIGLVVVMSAAAACCLRGQIHAMRGFILREWKAILLAEAVFLFLFLWWVVYRGYDASISHTEQPMDMAFLTASIRSFFGTPEDPWLRGEPISYYYFGHWMMAAKAQLLGTSPSVAYNLALALVPAMAGSAVFGLVYNMTSTGTRRITHAVVAGIGAAVLLTFVANLEGVLEFMRSNGAGSQAFWNWLRIDGLDGPSASIAQSWKPDEFWWWWRSSRVINTFVGTEGLDYTIQEFPFFSFLLGDLHAHVMSIPFVLLFLTLCLGLLCIPRVALFESGYTGFKVVMVPFRANISAILLAGVTGLSLGGLAFTNVWDLPVFASLFLGLGMFRAYTYSGGRLLPLLTDTVPLALVVIGLAFLLFLPYYLSFTSQFSGLHPVTVATTRPVHLFIVWGMFLVAVTPFMMLTFWQTSENGDYVKIAGISIFIGFIPFMAWYFLHLQAGGSTGDWWTRFAHVLPMALMVSAGTYSTLWYGLKGGSTGKLFGLLMATVGLMLILVPELVYVGDVFGNRMNSIFKFYYQAWILLTVASGFAIYHWCSLRDEATGFGRLALNLWGFAFAVVLVASIYYPLAAAGSKGTFMSGDWTLDGYAFVKKSRPEEYRAIQEIRQKVPRGSGLLEAVGRDYSEFGRISSATGVPTVLQWPGHEVQWRESADVFVGRENDVNLIYGTLDVEQAKTLLREYDVDYVYVGPLERQKYGGAGLAKFELFMDKWFFEGDVVIYRTRNP